MKKVSAIICALLVIVMLMSLAACGEEQPKPTESAQPAQTETVTEASQPAETIAPTQAAQPTEVIAPTSAESQPSGNQTEAYDGVYKVVSFTYMGEEVDEDVDISLYTITVTGTRVEIKYDEDVVIGIADYDNGLLYPENDEYGSPEEFNITGDTMTIGTEDGNMMILKKEN